MAEYVKVSDLNRRIDKYHFVDRGVMYCTLHTVHLCPSLLEGVPTVELSEETFTDYLPDQMIIATWFGDEDGEAALLCDRSEGCQLEFVRPGKLQCEGDTVEGFCGEPQRPKGLTQRRLVGLWEKVDDE